MNDLIDEVATDIKTENFYLAVKNFTKVFVALAVFILAITGGWVYFNNKHQEKQLAFNVAYYNLLNSNINDPDFQSKLDAINNDSEAFAPMANLFYAKKLIANKKFPEAYKILHIIYSNKNSDIAFANIAKTLLLSTAIEQNDKETNFAEITITDKHPQPFANLLKLSYAEYLLDINKKTEAKTVLNNLTTNNNDGDNLYYLATVLINNLGDIQ